MVRKLTGFAGPARRPSIAVPDALATAELCQEHLQDAILAGRQGLT